VRGDSYGCELGVHAVRTFKTPRGGEQRLDTLVKVKELRGVSNVPQSDCVVRPGVLMIVVVSRVAPTASARFTSDQVRKSEDLVDVEAALLQVLPGLRVELLHGVAEPERCASDSAIRFRSSVPLGSSSDGDPSGLEWWVVTDAGSAYM